MLDCDRRCSIRRNQLFGGGMNSTIKKMSFLRRKETFINAMGNRLQMPWENGFAAGTSLAV